MKTRAQIYSHEASGILRDIFTYGVLHRNRFWVYIHRRTVSYTHLTLPTIA